MFLLRRAGSSLRQSIFPIPCADRFEEKEQKESVQQRITFAASKGQRHDADQERYLARRIELFGFPS